MQIVSILAIFLAISFIIYKMNKAQQILKSQIFIDLERSKKIKVTGFLKNFWKRSIILIALLISWLLIIISTLFGDGTIYQFQVCVIAIIFCLLAIIVVIIFSKKYYKNIINYLM